MPKYHPEFNFIEMYQGYVKCKVINECNYKWQVLIQHIPEALDVVPLIFMHRVFTKFCRYIDRYRLVLTPAQFEFNSKKYKSHHKY